MVRTDPALYLPISERLLSRVLNEADAWPAALAGLAVPQIAALILLQYLPKIATRGPAFAERILVEAIKGGEAQAKRDGLDVFITDTTRALDREQIRAGHGSLVDLGIALIDDELLAQRAYLTPDGEWDSSFRERHQAREHEGRQHIVLPSGAHGVLTTEQTRVFREVKAQTNDHMHVQGYAGTGKSYLIKSLLLTLQGARVLVLAERHAQLEALLTGVTDLPFVYPRRFDVLVREMIPTDLTDPTSRRMSRPSTSSVPIPDEVVVRHLAIQACGAFSARDIVAVVRRTVAGFCYSAESEIDAIHIPKKYLASLDATTKQVVLHHATELWKTIVQPQTREFQPPVRGYHRVKWAALNRWQIPARYTHVLIDECHDLKAPMLQILDISPQAVISLGDEYQNLDGRPQRRANIVRQRAVTCSVRSGRLLEGVVNPIIEAHPGTTKYPFHGNALHRTEIVYYDRPQIPEQPAAILVSDTWGLFEWAQRLATQNLDFELLSSRDQLNMFVSDCIELRRHGTRPRHGELFRFGSWEALANRVQENRGFQRIDRMLHKGYDTKDWRKTVDKFAKQGKFALGLIDDVRNREFASVMLVPEVVDGLFDLRRDDFAAASSALYVGVTRAQRRLIVPERLRSWLEEISARGRGPSRPQSLLASPYGSQR